MATGNEKQEINELLQSNEFQECMENLKKYEEVKPVKIHGQLKQRFREAEFIFDLLADVLDLISGFVPVVPLSTISLAIKGFLLLFKVLGKKSSKIKVFEQQTYIDIDIQRKAFAVNSALFSSIRYLQAIQTRNLNGHEIAILQSQVPRETGVKFLSELEHKITELRGGEREMKARETEDETTDKKAGNKTGVIEEESEDKTLQRCNAIIALIDLYCVMSHLRDLVMYYLVLVFANNGVSENITKSYLKRREQFKNNREAILKVLYEPEVKDASVAAVFLPKKWPKLRHQLGSRPDLGDLIDRPQHIISAFTKDFSMYRYDPNVRNLFRRTKYVRVMANTETKFVFRSEGDQEFKIHLSGHNDFTWRMSGDRGALLETSRTTQEEQCDKFKIVRLSNGNVMFSSQKRPTCFIRMENAKDNEKLGVANNGYDKNCQWKLIG